MILSQFLSNKSVDKATLETSKLWEVRQQLVDIILSRLEGICEVWVTVGS